MKLEVADSSVSSLSPPHSLFSVFILNGPFSVNPHICVGFSEFIFSLNERSTRLSHHVIVCLDHVSSLSLFLFRPHLQHFLDLFSPLGDSVLDFLFYFIYFCSRVQRDIEQQSKSLSVVEDICPPPSPPVSSRPFFYASFPACPPPSSHRLQISVHSVKMLLKWRLLLLATTAQRLM